MLKLNIISQITRFEQKRLIATSQHSKLFKRLTSPPPTTAAPYAQLTKALLKSDKTPSQA